MPKRILFIDDEVDFTELTKSLFEFQGFETEAINDPLDGMNRFEEESFDALIVDFMMPGLDGLTLIKKLRENKAHENKPFFILSAKKLTEQERKDLLTNKTHFVSKPFEPRRLVELVRENLND